jgi:hypothetical protein
MRKMVTPQRDMVSTMMAQVVTIPGMTTESERYVRDLYDHLIRISSVTFDIEQHERGIHASVAFAA